MALQFSYAGVAQTVELRSCKPPVVGATPTTSPNLQVSSNGRASVFQTDDRGSSPRTRSNY